MRAPKARAVVPALISHGSLPVYVGRVKGLLLGRNEAGFGRVTVVRYRSLRDFLHIFTDPRMQAGVDRKFASMASTESRAAAPVLSFLSVRLTATLLFGLLGVRCWISTRDRARPKTGGVGRNP